jgi:hypothetical protein
MLSMMLDFKYDNTNLQIKWKTGNLVFTKFYLKLHFYQLMS